MHLSDGFLNNEVSAGLIGAAIGAVVLAVKKVRQKLFEKVPVRKRKLAVAEGLDVDDARASMKYQLTRAGENKIYKMALVGAFIFAMQMINFPVMAGTSGHLMGGVLAAIILGPFEGFIVIAIVLTLQSLFFGDGGLVALGANIVNMGIIGSIGGYYIYNFFRKKLKRRLLSAFLAAWISLVLASAVCAIELAWSGSYSLVAIMKAMVGIHILIGLGEGLITVLILILLLKYFPKFLKNEKQRN